MNLHPTQRLRPALTVLAWLACSASWAAGKPNAPDPESQYHRDRAACSAMRVADEQANCLSEASARLASTQPSLAEEHPDILKRNALMRCTPQPDARRSDCVARMQGQGSTRGSVAAGGIYRELVTREVGTIATVAPVAPVAPDAAAAPSPAKP